MPEIVRPDRDRLGGEAYLRRLAGLVEALADTQVREIRDAGARIGASVATKGVVHLFGAGHSRLAAEDVFIRAGSLNATRTIWPDRLSDKFERHEGLGSTVLSLADIRPGEVLVVISNSGINPMPIDVALQAKQMGAYTLGIGSREHSLTAASRHSTGTRLLEVCDAFLDTKVPAGDALISESGLPAPAGPASTIISAALLHAVLLDAAAWLVRHGHQPPLRMSRNLPGGDEHNAALSRMYADRIPELRWV